MVALQACCMCVARMRTAWLACPVCMCVVPIDSPSNGGNSVKWTKTSHHHMLFPMPLLHALCTDGKPSPTGSP